MEYRDYHHTERAYMREGEMHGALVIFFERAPDAAKSDIK